MCGEDSPPDDDVATTQGSPPHARGRLDVEGLGSTLLGITPACAGKTPSPLSVKGAMRDHPRIRGEDALYTAPALRAAWITPACAGKTMPDGFSAEKAVGSPPHARGRPASDEWDNVDVRLTPACAGKTNPRSPTPACPTAHPRMRGEDTSSPFRETAMSGSPPHARGRRSRGDRPVKRCRLTPACAGKTRRPRSERGHLPAHPRMRGEDSCGASPSVSSTGSPPHARGRCWRTRRGGLLCRLTPACAGKTVVGVPTAARLRAHPRMRGEDASFAWVEGKKAGSPPHARGRRRP